MIYDKDFAAICAWLKNHGLTAHTDRNGKTILRKKKGPRVITRAALFSKLPD